MSIGQSGFKGGISYHIVQPRVQHYIFFFTHVNISGPDFSTAMVCSK